MRQGQGMGCMPDAGVQGTKQCPHRGSDQPGATEKRPFAPPPLTGIDGVCISIFPRKTMKLTGDRNQCRMCGEAFNSTTAFDKHRVGEFGVDRRCRTAVEMREIGMVLRDNGFWVGSIRDADSIPRVRTDGN